MKYNTILTTSVTILSILFCLQLPAQTPDTLWTNKIGGTNSDVGYSVQQTNDNGFIIAGSTNSFGAGDYDVYLVKTNQDGDTLWTRTFGGELRDFGTEVQQTDDGGYIVIGGTKSYNNGVDDLYLIKTDSNGDTLWTKVYGGAWGDLGTAIKQDSDGSYIATGYTMSSNPGNADVWVLKFDENGDTLWTKTIDFVSDIECGNEIKILENGGYILIGYTTAPVLNANIFLIKLDPSGNTVLGHLFLGQGSETAEDVVELEDGGFIITGYTILPSTSDYNCLLMRVDYFGEILWSKSYGGEADDKTYAIELVGDGFVLGGYTHNVGTTERDAFIIKTDFNGDTIWTKTIGGPYNDWIFDIAKTYDNGLILTGQYDLIGDDSHDLWLVRLDKVITNLSTEIPFSSYKLHANYPNPFNPTTNIRYEIPERSFVTVRVYDVLGNEIAKLVSEEKLAGEYEVEFNATTLPSGIYLYQLKAGSFIESKKMVFIK